MQDDTMSEFAAGLLKAASEAVAHANGEDTGAIVHEPKAPAEVRKSIKATQKEMAQLMNMSLSGYRKWEQGRREVSGPANVLLRVIEKEPDAVLRALS